MGYIVDLSHHQNPKKIDYDKFAKQLNFAIIRTQYGSLTVDTAYKTHHAELRKRGVPTAAYAWVRGVSENDMRVEARDFYNRTKDINPTFWFLDVEEKSMNDMRTGIKAYVKELRSLGAKKVGVYIAHHLYKSFNLDMSDFDAVWIPRYGTNNGKPQTKPDYPCDLWQYTSVGRLEGYSGSLDLSVIISDKPLSFFTGEKEKVTVNPESEKSKPNSSSNGSNHIKQFQSWLNNKYKSRLIVDGIYGKETKAAAVKALQTELNKKGAKLKVDGIFGSKTKDAVQSYRKSTQGNIVKIIQGMLHCLGFNPGAIDGIFGERTASAVKAFQKAKGLGVDAIVGKNTFEAMFK